MPRREIGERFLAPKTTGGECRKRTVPRIMEPHLSRVFGELFVGVERA